MHDRNILTYSRGKYLGAYKMMDEISSPDAVIRQKAIELFLNCCTGFKHIKFNSLWDNGRGFNSGAAVGTYAPKVPPGDGLAFVDDYCRRGFILGTIYGNIVFYESVTPSNGMFDDTSNIVIDTPVQLSKLIGEFADYKIDTMLEIVDGMTNFERLLRRINNPEFSRKVG